MALGALFLCATTGVVPEDQLFTGFSNPATITVVMVLILSYGLTKSGAIEGIAQIIQPFADRPLLHTGILVFFAAFLSMFMNNVGALALLMPIAIQTTNKTGRSPATVLMPLSFGSILGGLVTLIGTPVGGGIAIAGILFMLLNGWKLVKVRKKSAGLELFDVEKYLFELKITETSTIVDITAEELQDSVIEQGIDLLCLIHKRQKFTVVPKKHILSINDLILVQGSQDEIDKMVSSYQLHLLAAENAQKEVLHSEDTQILEVVVTRDSQLEGKTVAPWPHGNWILACVVKPSPRY